ncbi:MAG: helix-turn-helix domain-containing protein [Amylibacter sp.]|nr:helix-turn-helix domain-containing protein [Amylibacter sp.]
MATCCRNGWPHTSEYADHVEKGIPLRKIARRDGVHASTVLRRVRKIEARRDDPLLDDILSKISDETQFNAIDKEARVNVQKKIIPQETEASYDKDMLRILRRLCEQSAFMVMSLELPKAVVMRGHGQMQVRSAVLTRELGQKLLIKDWIERTGGSKFHRYEITNAGRAGFKRMLAQQSETLKNNGFAEAPSPFQEQHREWGERVVSCKGARPKRIRVNLRESPINSLGRKKGKDGKPFLANELLQAGERFREDFELAQLGPRVAQNWDRFLLGSDRGNFSSGEGGGSSAAQSRLRKALTALGPGLGDIALRCCCFLEGMEAAEKRMGWSARSGKVVLRIALQRLRIHYDEVYGGVSDKIG